MMVSEVDTGRLAAAYDAGWRLGLAVSALAVGLVAFLSLLGAEKAILAIVLGTLAARGSMPGALPRRLGAAAIALGMVFLLTALVLLTLFWDQAAEMIRLLQKLS